jgi:hypothetical protein
LKVRETNRALYKDLTLPLILFFTGSGEKKELGFFAAAVLNDNKEG